MEGDQSVNGESLGSGVGCPAAHVTEGAGQRAAVPLLYCGLTLPSVPVSHITDRSSTLAMWGCTGVTI
jgi:hypothetical protein